jgi:hypothetical protein
MKRSLGLLAATTLLAAGAVTVGTGSVGAAATSTPVVPIVQTLGLPLDNVYPSEAIVFVVHGLNLDGQDAQTDGGTPVTVCAGGAMLLTDLQFGDIAGPKQAAGLQIAPGTEVDLTVFLGADADCTGPDPVITQTVTVPDTPVVALVATAGPDGSPELLPVVIDIDPPRSCLQEILPGSTTQGDTPEAKLGAVHAAAAGPVVLTVDGNPAPSPLSFGDSIFDDGPAGAAEVEVTLDGTPIVGPVEIDFEACTLTTIFVVGNQPIAEEPTTTTTAPAPAPAAQAVAARPAFTG